MKTNQRRVTLAVGAAAGGLLTAAFLPMAVAFADNYDFTPDTSTFEPTQVEGYPPLINEVTGAEDWSITDVTNGTVAVQDVFLGGTDTQTTIGSFTNDDFIWGNSGEAVGVGSGSTTFEVPGGTQVDLADFGSGFENEWIDVPGTGLPDSGISDVLITPFGDFPLLGSFFADLASALG